MSLKIYRCSDFRTWRQRTIAQWFRYLLPKYKGGSYLGFRGYSFCIFGVGCSLKWKKGKE